MTSHDLIKKIIRDYTVVIDGKRYIKEGSIPSVVQAVFNSIKVQDN